MTTIPNPSRPRSPLGRVYAAPCPGCPLCPGQHRKYPPSPEQGPMDLPVFGRLSEGLQGEHRTGFHHTRSDPALATSCETTQGARQLNRPPRIILVRHGESLGNIDETIYTREADWRVPLTDQGMEQAVEAGRKIRELIEKAHSAEGDPREWGVFFYVSPYLRTLQTLRGIGRAFEAHRILGVREEPRLREQDFGNFQISEKMEMTKDARQRFGKFFFRFPDGESAADVYDRATGFLDSFWRDIEWGRMHPSLRQQSKMGSFSSLAPDGPSDTALRATRPDVTAQVEALRARHVSGDEVTPGQASGAPEQEAGRVLGAGMPHTDLGLNNGTNAEGQPESSGVPRSQGASWQTAASDGFYRPSYTPAHRHSWNAATEKSRRDSQRTADGGCGKKYVANVVMVTHGLTSRVFLMRWFRWTVGQFEGLGNPKNCEIRAMQLSGQGRYSLALQHTPEEMLSWGMSPCMVADQISRAKDEDRNEHHHDAPPPWACFFDHIPRPWQNGCVEDMMSEEDESPTHSWESPDELSLRGGMR